MRQSVAGTLALVALLILSQAPRTHTLAAPAPPPTPNALATLVVAMSTLVAGEQTQLSGVQSGISAMEGQLAVIAGILGRPTPTPPPTATPTPTATATPTSTPLPTPTPVPWAPGPGHGGGDSCPPGSFGFGTFLIPICINLGGLLANLFAAIGGLFKDPVSALTAPFSVMLTQTPDPSASPGLQAFYDHMQSVARDLFALFFFLAVLRYLLTSLLGDSPYEALGALRRAVLGLGAVTLLPWALSEWFGVLNAFATDINGYGGNATLWVLEHLVQLIVAGVANPLLGLIYALFAVVVLILFLLIGVTRLSGLFLLAVLYALAPVMAVSLVSPEFKRFARWWFEAFVNVSLWGLGYALVFKATQIIWPSLTGAPPYNDPVIAPLVGLAGLLVLYRVPRIIGSIVGGATMQAAGATVTSDTVVQTALNTAQAAVRSWATHRGGSPPP